MDKKSSLCLIMSEEEKVEETFIPNAEEVAMCLEIRENLKKANVEAEAVVAAARRYPKSIGRQGHSFESSIQRFDCLYESRD